MLHVFVGTITCNITWSLCFVWFSTESTPSKYPLHVSIDVLRTLSDSSLTLWVSELICWGSQTNKEHGASSNQLHFSFSFTLSRNSSNSHQIWYPFKRGFCALCIITCLIFIEFGVVSGHKNQIFGFPGKAKIAPSRISCSAMLDNVSGSTLLWVVLSQLEVYIRSGFGLFAIIPAQ